MVKAKDLKKEYEKLEECYKTDLGFFVVFDFGEWGGVTITPSATLDTSVHCIEIKNKVAYGHTIYNHMMYNHNYIKFNKELNDIDIISDLCNESTYSISQDDYNYEYFDNVVYGINVAKVSNDYGGKEYSHILEIEGTNTKVLGTNKNVIIENADKIWNRMSKEKKNEYIIFQVVKTQLDVNPCIGVDVKKDKNEIVKDYIVNNSIDDFQEEKEHLKITLKEIDKDIKKQQYTINNLKSEVDPRNIFDYEDLDRWKYAKYNYDKAKESVYELNNIRKNPYFARIDLEIKDSSEADEYYIGETSLVQDYSYKIELKIIDWRTDIANIYYSSDITGSSFIVKGVNYDLVLRRKLEIINSELISCETTYDAYNAELDGEVVDTFLIKVLKDKRRDRKVTNIIKTIQSEQNSIIRQSKEANFILQGCAGSGKTMILLHRLSYILFNKMYIPEDIIVVTPNKFFDSQINDLSKELGLNDIERLTVDEYYQHLLNCLTGRKVSKTILSENLLNHEMLEKVYSKEYKLNLINKYNLLVDEFYQIINNADVRNVINKAGIVVPVPDTSSRSIAKFVSIYKDCVREIDNYYNNLVRQKKYEEEIAEINKKAIGLIMPLLVPTEDKIIDINNECIVAQNKINEIMALNSEDQKMIEEFKKESFIPALDKDKILSLDYLESANDNVAKYIKEKCGSLYSKVEHLKKQKDRIPSYNFIRKNQIQNDLDKATKAYLESVKKAIDTYEKENVTTDFTVEISELEKTIRARNEDISKLKSIIENNRKLILDYNNTVSCIENAKSVDEIIDVYKQNKFEKDITEELQSLKKEQENPEKNLFSLIMQQRVILKTHKEFDKLETVDYEGNKKLRNKLRKYEFDGIYSSLVKELKEYKEKVDMNDTKYRFQLYLRLLVASWYYPTVKSSKRLVCFDEAQDLSPREYDLFVSLNRNECIYNLYGDINQAINDYESALDWSELEFANEYNNFVLNQNYRNSSQITDYCNKNFGSNILPIGIKGDSDVIEEKLLDKSIKILKNIKLADETKRCVIIFTDNNIELSNRLKNISTNNDFAWNKLDDNKISVLPVSMVKGLEFDAVLVIDDGMQMNEQYISYTRALDNLIVCKQEL